VNYLIIGLICLVLLILMIYLYTKDSESSRKFFLYERAIEDLNKKIYELEKSSKREHSADDDEEFKNYIDEIFESSMEKITHFIVTSRKKDEEDIKKLIDKVDSKLAHVEEKLKAINTIPESYQMNDKKIVNLYEKGLSVSEIARNLRVGIGEVELVLKIAGIK